MLFKCEYKSEKSYSKNPIEKSRMLAKRMLPEYVFDTAQMENNPLAFPEVKTLIDGITIGDHKISDVEQVFNIKEAWAFLLASIKTDSFSISKSFFNKLNGILLKNGIGVFNIKAKDILEFNTLMIKFYDTQDANEVAKFLSEKAILGLGE